jgi:hypothetical protein
VKSIYISTYLSEALEAMSRDTGLTVAGLVNQATFVWLTQHGYDLPLALGAILRDTAAGERSSSGDAPAASAPTAAPVRPSAPASAAAPNGFGPPVLPSPQTSRPPQPRASASEASVPWKTEGDSGSYEATNVGFANGLSPRRQESVAQTLQIKREDNTPVRVEAERFLIGRGPQCDMVISSPRVSREHAVITKENGSYVLKDLGSSNGTWLNGERLTRRELTNGDVIVLGTEALTFILKA